MAGIRPVHDLARQRAAVMIEAHVEILRAHARGLSRRTLRSAAEDRADIAEPRHSDRRPAEQSRAKNAKGDRHRQLPSETGKGRNSQRDNAADELDHARKHDGIGRTKHLQQRIKNDNSDDAGNQSWHRSNIIALAAKCMAAVSSPRRDDAASGLGQTGPETGLGGGLTDHFIWPISLAAPLPVFDSFSSASRPPAA